MVACGIFRWGLRNLIPQPEIEPGPLQGERGVLATGPPGTSLLCVYIERTWQGRHLQEFQTPWSVASALPSHT